MEDPVTSKEVTLNGLTIAYAKEQNIHERKGRERQTDRQTDRQTEN